MKILRNIWILEYSGIVLYHRKYDDTVLPQLFGAMMSALNIFAESLSEGLLSFEVGLIRFTTIKKNNLLFTATTTIKISPKKVSKELKKISKRFFQNYSEKIKNFKGNIDDFIDFASKIESSIEDKEEI